MTVSGSRPAVQSSRRRARRRRRRVIVVMAAIGVVVAATVGVLNALPSSPPPPPGCTVTAPTGPQFTLTPDQAQNAAIVAAVGSDRGCPTTR